MHVGCHLVVIIKDFDVPPTSQHNIAIPKGTLKQQQ